MQEIATMKDTVDIVTNIMSLPFADVYDVSAEIGRGKFAVVKRCKHKTSGMEYAAKYLKKRRKGKDCKKEVLHEVHMLELAITHPHIIKLIEVYETNLDLIIITDFAKGGELFEYITVEGQLKECVTIRLLRQILDGLSFLHANNIAHLDVKPQNILLTDALPHGDIKLCDFGLARLFNCGHDILEIIGTPDYVAPEVLDYKPLGSECDMWSIGVLTYVMLTGFSPFAGDTTQETYLNISQVNLDFPDDLFENISKDALKFMRSVLIKDPLDRLTARQSLNHAWLNQTSEPSCSPVTSVGSPSGQRRSVEATKDPDFHKPIKKSRCDTNSDNEAQSRHSTESNPNEQEKENLNTVPEKSFSTSKQLSTSFDATQPVSTSFDTANPVSTSFSATKAVSSLTKFKFNSLELPNSIPSDLKRNDLPSDSLKCCDDCHRRKTHVSSMTWLRDSPEMERRELGEVMV